MAGESALSPGPHEVPALHDAITIGAMLFPADPLEGGVKVAIKTGAELDQQKANGKDVARTKAKGKKVAKLSFTFRFTRTIYAPSNALRVAIDPGGDNNGRAWEVKHPECSDRRINAVMFTEMGALEIAGDSFSFNVEADGWYEPAAAMVGGTKTPKTAVPGGEAGGITQALFDSGFARADDANPIRTDVFEGPAI